MREANLRLGAALAEVEGLYTALLKAGSPRRRRRLRAELARAAGRLAELAAAAPGSESRATGARRSRWGRRRILAERGAEWIAARYRRDVP
ncbi:hypothetical protein [Streptomyces sp. NPDC048277]|uniref:hypothetical protein n=1 Tax=Streptomyces sp. NPDC048277 TaxID=3155027 RepID=UPI0033C9E84F